MQLQIKHLAPYLSYKLTFQEGEDLYTLYGLCSDDNLEFVTGRELASPQRSLNFRLDQFKPLLYPLENLLHDCPEEIRDEFSEFNFENLLHKLEFRVVDVLDIIPVPAFLKMVELKYDVFRLIPQGLALDINTVVTK